MFSFRQSFTLGNWIRFVGISALIIGLLFYVHFQARNLITGPTITLSHEYEPVQHERSITLTGNAQNIVELTLNGKEIHTNKQGDFSHLLVLESGYTIVELAAQDRFGRKTSLLREFVYVPPSAPEL